MLIFDHGLSNYDLKYFGTHGPGYSALRAALRILDHDNELNKMGYLRI
jgi:hypothetical protein